MRATTVRFSDALWKLLERESRREGVSAAQFIRDATIMRTAYAMGQRGDAGFDDALGRTVAPPEPTPRGWDTAPAGAPRRGRRGPGLRRLDALRATGLLDSDVTRRSTASPGSPRTCSTRP